MTYTKQCECTNYIPDDADRCEWCEHPDPPMYVIGGDEYVTLTFLGIRSLEAPVALYMYDHNVTVFAPSIESAKAIFDDYIAQQTEGGDA